VLGVAISRIRFEESFALPAHKSDQAEGRSAVSEARLRLLMTAHFDFVWRSLRRLGLLGADADDGAQEVFLVASRKLAQILDGHERQFLFATAVRVASTRRRTVQRRREEPLSPLYDQEREERSEPGPERLTEMSRARRELQAILDGMELEQRAPFILFELEELTVPEIAGTLSIPIGTVSSRLRAARDYFRAAVSRLHARDAFQKGPP
jgi:RNA polymerase sigma-70 factor (ECF subfamily)